MDANRDPELEDACACIFNATVTTWPALVQVCRRWRYLALGFPRRLHLGVKFTGTMSLTKMPDVWSQLPIWITRECWDGDSETAYVGNIVALLESEHCGRVHGITLMNLESWRWGRIAALIQMPFPQLTYLGLGLNSRDMEQVFAQGNLFPIHVGPRLQSLCFTHFPFPVMPMLFLSANQLVHLNLCNTPELRYLSPEEIVLCLSLMNKLVSLHLGIESLVRRYDSPSDHNPSLLPTRFVLPALTKLAFHGDREYLEDLVAHINAPLLHKLEIYLYIDVTFDIPHFHQFISRTEGFKSLDRAKITFMEDAVAISLAPQMASTDESNFLFEIMYTESDWLLSAIAEACQSSLPPLSTLESLNIEDDPHSPPRWKDDMAGTEWRDLLNPFVSVTELFLTRDIALRVGHVLQNLSMEEATEVLPEIQDIYLKGVEPFGPAQDAIGKFVAARQLAGHLVELYNMEEISRAEELEMVGDK
jgi:hypothetical protein